MNKEEHMSWKICHGCGGKGFAVLKDKDKNEIMNKCIICNGQGMVFVEQTYTLDPWDPCDAYRYPYKIPYYPCRANDTTSWSPNGVTIQY